MVKLFFVPKSGNYRIVLDSDSLLYGGHQRVNDTMIYPTKLKGRATDFGGV
ncbi:MAG: hypothetical protein PHR53_08200 [Bacteroidales bacterium]|nr:hypothetical protein [Bacteroidales bacterium]